MASALQDSDWVKDSMMLPKFAVDAISKRQQSSAFEKYTDTSLGGNFVINPPPQFTATADLKARGPFSGADNDYLPQSFGMGRKYSEMIDDNSQVIHMRFGVPQYNSLTRFFNGFYNPVSATLSRTGREPGFFYSLGRVAGFVVTLPLQPFLLAGKIYSFLSGNPPSKYYFLKPVMPLYWNAVNGMANGIAVNMGIIPRVLTNNDNVDPQGKGKKLNAKAGSESDDEDAGAGEGVYEAESDEDYTHEFMYKGDNVPRYTDADIENYHKLMPDVFKRRGGIDVYAVASRAQRVRDAVRTRIEEAAAEAGDYASMQQAVDAYITGQSANNIGNVDTDPKFAPESPDQQPGISAYMAAWSKQEASKPPKDDKSPSDSVDENRSWWDKYAEFTSSEIRDGGQFVSFRVNHTGTVSESFNNSVGESSLASSLNGTSADLRSKRFNFAEGNLGGGFIGDMIGGVMGAATDLANGVAESFGVSGLMAVLGNAFVDIPKTWQDSDVTLPTMSYEIELRSPYGDKMSRFQNLYVPLCMLLAGALPKSAGKHSYDAPFLVEIYDKGRAQTRLGVVDSMNVSRGEGNLGWTKEQEPLGINISFNVVDLSSIMHMPLNAAPGLFDEQTSYTDYLAVLGSLSLRDQIYSFNQLRLNLTRSMTNWNSWTSPAKWGQWTANTFPGRTISAMAREMERN